MTEKPALPIPTFDEVVFPDRFAGKTVIVTGAGSGIGKATAMRIAREGGRVVVSDISGERLTSLVNEYPDLDLVACVSDISKSDDVAKILEVAGSEIYGLVNNAGIMDFFEPVGEVSDETWDRVFAVNVGGMVKLTRAVLPIMLKAGIGSVVNVASEAGIRGSAAGAAYTASKHAVVGLTKNSAFMYATSGVRFNAVAPGATMTNIVAEFRSELAGKRLGPLFATVLPSAAYPDELAASITFLLSTDSPNVTGVVLPSDGGWSAI
jgi:NAD(P)-dependent dehydrogenase (short-subunit alcohol dehydrogenase family)